MFTPDAMQAMLWPLTIWHWLAIALLLFAIEMMLGTFDLLMVALAALATALWTAAVPDALAGWQVQLVVFFTASVALILLGRTVFSRLRAGGPGDPLLNDRMSRLQGARGQVVADFTAGQGKVRIGDTEWLAESVSGGNLKAGTGIRVLGSHSTRVMVEPI